MRGAILSCLVEKADRGVIHASCSVVKGSATKSDRSGAFSRSHEGMRVSTIHRVLLLSAGWQRGKFTDFWRMLDMLAVPMLADQINARSLDPLHAALIADCL